MAEPLRLFGRSSSHFTRAVRIVAHELAIALPLVPVHDLRGTDPAAFGGNPALKVPTLAVGEDLVFGAENACRELVAIANVREGAVLPLPAHVDDRLVRSAQELVVHAMGAQVTLRMGLTVNALPEADPYFVKTAASLRGALGWLDEKLPDVLARLPAGRRTSYFEVTLFCLVEHLAFLPPKGAPLGPYPALAREAAAFGTRPSARSCPYLFDPAPP